MASRVDVIRTGLRQAVAHFWRTRARQAGRQGRGPGKDRGARAAVTGGKQMDGFASLLEDLAVSAGIREDEVFRRKAVELPGFFRPTKEWDLLVVGGGELVAAVELKSHVGPSFGNNFNNRTEEAMGSALDIWTAFREGAFGTSGEPWLGYLMHLEDCPTSRSAVAVREPHFPVLREFHGASYRKRYELFCRRLVRERQYTKAAFLVSGSDGGMGGRYEEPSADLAFEGFAVSLLGRLETYVKTRAK